MKIGPGVDLNLPRFQCGEGLFFQPQGGGVVRVLATNGEPPTNAGQNCRADVTLSAAQWAGVAAGAETEARDDGGCWLKLVQIESGVVLALGTPAEERCSFRLSHEDLEAVAQFVQDAG